MIYRLRCPDCSGKFSHEGEDFPNYCPLCGSFCGIPDDGFVPTKVNIGTEFGKSGDVAYRMLEQSSADNAERMGDPTLKVTNLKDNLREGDVAAMPAQPSKEYQAIVKDMQQAPDWSGVAPGGLSTQDVIGLANQGRKSGSGATALRAIQGGAGAAPPSVAGGTLKGNFGGGIG